MKKAILFDIDGTLLNSWDFIYDAVKHAISTQQILQPTDEQIEDYIGKALVAFYQALLPEADSEALAKAHREFQERYFYTLKPFPKTRKTLIKLKNQGFLLAAVSNRTGNSLHRSLKLTKIFDYFDVIVSVDDVSHPKPHKEHLLTALRKLKVAPESAFMVGDMEQDILGGKNAKIKTIGVTYGFLGKDIAKHSPDYLIDDIEQLMDILK